MAGTLYLLAFIVYWQSRSEGNGRAYVASICLFALALLCKPTAIGVAPCPGLHGEPLFPAQDRSEGQSLFLAWIS